MKIAVASDEKTYLTDFVVADLQARGHELLLLGPLAGKDLPWPPASLKLAVAVAHHQISDDMLFQLIPTGL